MGMWFKIGGRMVSCQEWFQSLGPDEQAAVRAAVMGSGGTAGGTPHERFYAAFDDMAPQERLKIIKGHAEGLRIAEDAQAQEDFWKAATEQAKARAEAAKGGLK